jgi:hypothetical protein
MHDPQNPNPEEVAVLAGIWQDMFFEAYGIKSLAWEPKKMKVPCDIQVPHTLDTSIA